MVAVLPFENLTGDPAQEYFSDGLTEEMIAQLGHTDPRLSLGVIARTSVMHLEHTGGTGQIGHELGAQCSSSKGASGVMPTRCDPHS